MPIQEVGTLVGRDVLLMMRVYQDANGSFVIKTTSGMCGIESRNIYFQLDKAGAVEIEGNRYAFRNTTVTSSNIGTITSNWIRRTFGILHRVS